MSIALRLASNEASLKCLTDEIDGLCNSVDVSEVVKDSNFKQSIINLSDWLGLTLFQLHAQLQEVDDVSERLNYLWLIKALVQEINVSLNPVGDSIQYTCDREELEAIFQNLKKLKARIEGIDKEDLKITAALKASYNELVDELLVKLKELFAMFVPDSTDKLVHIINKEIKVRGVLIKLEDFLSLAFDIESFFSRNDIADRLTRLKILWDKEILDKLVKKQSYFLELVEDNVSIKALLNKSPHLRKTLSTLYFESLKSFIMFINVLENQMFKNYYSTKISNDLVYTVSENIRVFMNNRERLTDDLVEILELLAKNDWSVPIRNVFKSQEKVNESLQTIYAGWVTDKYINEVREVFNNKDFESNFSNLKDAIQENREQKLLQEDNTWGDWGSEDEHNLDANEFDNWSVGESSKNNDEADDWDNWNDEWDDDASESNVKPQKSSKIPAERNYSVKLADERFEATLKYSPIPFKLSILLTKFSKEANNENIQEILDTIAALSSISYPQLTKLFLFFNDLKRVKSDCDYLSQVADQEWNQARAGLIDDVARIITSIDYNSEDLKLENDLSSIKKGLGQFQKFIDQLFAQDLEATNSEMFNLLIIEVMNFANNLIIEEILTSSEISEIQSEKLTLTLEGLKLLENQNLSRIGVDLAKLASFNKVSQAAILLNNHLKEIMDYFYQGELHAFSTEELVKVIKSVFVPSDLRENCIGDIIEIRNS